MAEIIPTILVKSFEEVKERIAAVEKYVNWVQLDIMDGIFVDNITWPYTEGSINDLEGLKTKVHPVKSRKVGSPKATFNRVKIEAHLMIENPEEVIDDWLKVVDRIIIHFESKIPDLNSLIKRVRNSGKQIGLALNPETHFTVATPFLKDLDLVLFMAAQPGRGGQKFKEWILEKIKALRKIWPKGNIEVDCGVNNENIGRIAKAGANLFNVGAHIYKSKNIKKAIAELKYV